MIILGQGQDDTPVPQADNLETLTDEDTPLTDAVTGSVEGGGTLSFSVVAAPAHKYVVAVCLQRIDGGARRHSRTVDVCAYGDERPAGPRPISSTPDIGLVVDLHASIRAHLNAQRRSWYLEIGGRLLGGRGPNWTDDDQGDGKNHWHRQTNTARSHDAPPSGWKSISRTSSLCRATDRASSLAASRRTPGTVPR